VIKAQGGGEPAQKGYGTHVYVQFQSLASHNKKSNIKHEVSLTYNTTNAK